MNRTSAMIVTIKTTTFIPSNGMLEITFPSNIWSEGAVTSTTNYLPISSSMSCSNLSLVICLFIKIECEINITMYRYTKSK